MIEAEAWQAYDPQSDPRPGTIHPPTRVRCGRAGGRPVTDRASRSGRTAVVRAICLLVSMRSDPGDAIRPGMSRRQMSTPTEWFASSPCRECGALIRLASTLMPDPVSYTHLRAH